MKHYMIGISGFSGSGKDTVANRLIEKFKSIRIGLADPAKRHMADLYGFTEEQLFGPSEKRNAGDLRYPKHSNLDSIKKAPNEIGDVFLDHVDYTGSVTPNRITLDHHTTYYSFYESNGSFYDLPYEKVNTNKRIYYVKEGDPNYWLSPREALQKYCELMNSMYLNTWIRKSIETQIQVAKEWKHCSYSNMKGVTERLSNYDSKPYIITCSPDFRHKHEIKLLREYERDDVISILIRVKRPSISKPPYPHRSEIEQAGIPDSEFDFVLDNGGSIHDLDVKTDKAIAQMLETGHPQATIFI